MWGGSRRPTYSRRGPPQVPEEAPFGLSSSAGAVPPARGRCSRSEGSDCLLVFTLREWEVPLWLRKGRGREV